MVIKQARQSIQLNKGSVLSKKLYSAAEIAKMAIPGLPATRANIGLKAEREGWYSEERIGIGGARKVYEVPPRYLERLALQEGEPADQRGEPIKQPDIAAGGAVDPALFKVAVRLTEKMYARNPNYDPAMKAEIALLIYNLGVAKGMKGNLTDEQILELERQLG